MQRHQLTRTILAGATALWLLITASLHAQVVSSSMTGTVWDESGKAVAGATVLAKHESTGTAYAAVSNNDGRFNFRGMIVGGPYTVVVQARGFVPESKSEIYTQLAAEAEVRFTLKTGDVVQMEKFKVVTERLALDGGTTGAASVLSRMRLDSQPTVNRSFSDMIRVNPFVSIRTGSALVALGQNNKFNSISVDGARVNDSFGLWASGLASFNNPFAMDAIEEFNVALSPYDIRQSGFTGASVNVITKRGTNSFSGSAYYIYTDAHRQGPDLFGTSIGQRTPLKQVTQGLTFGGPIIKDKLFFFINYEDYSSQTSPSQPSYTPDAAALATIKTRLAQLTSIDMGGFGGAATNKVTDKKRLIKFDWNINADHRLSVRFSDTKGVQPNFGSYNATGFSVAQAASPTIAFPNGSTSFTSSFYTENRTEKVWAGQIFSNWTPEFKTQFNYSRITFDDPSVTPVAFPQIRIYGVPGISKSGVPITDGALRFGTEESRHGNIIKVQTTNYALSGDYFWNQFTFTGGADYEKSEFYNLYRQGSYGVFDFTNIADFVNDVTRGFSRAFVQTGTPLADVSEFKQNGFFGQAKWDISSRLNVTLGVRADFIGSPIAPLTNTAFKNAFGITNAGTVDGTQRVAPRISANYSLDKERNTQVRGGVGVFLGRAPWVFLSNSYSNTGVGRYSLIQSGAAAPKLSDYLKNSFSSTNPIGQTASDPGGVRVINLVQEHLQLPTVLRGNIALDHKITALGAIFSIEYIETKALKALFIDNMNINPTTVGADGRQRFAGSASNAPRIAGYGNVFRVRNIGEGGSQYLSMSFDRPMKNHWAYAVGYTRGHATDAQNFGSSTASSNWTFNSVFNQNRIEVSRSDYEVKNRIQGSLTREFALYGKAKTTVSLYYEGRTGNAYSWTYSGDLNGDGISGNDLLVVPTGLTDTRFDFSGMTAQQQAAYFAFLEDSGLNKFRGAAYASRNAFYQPWMNRLDLRFSQEIPTVKSVKLEVFCDFLNFGSWISRKMFNYVESLPTQNTGLTRVLGNASYNAAGQIKPTVTLDAAGRVVLPTNSLVTIHNNDSRWRIQFGARLKF